MKYLTTNDATMKALRAHCLQIEPESPAAESADTELEDSYNWFHLESPTHAERYPTRPLTQRSHNEEQIHNEWWTRNGKVDAAAVAQIAKQNEKAAQDSENLTITELIKAELNDIREKHHRRRRRRQAQQAQQQKQQQNKTVESLKIIESVKNRKSLEGLVAKGAALAEARKQFVDAHKDYERAYEENLMELEYGPGCRCLRHPWQHEVLPPKAMWGARWGAGKRVQWEGKGKEMRDFGVWALL